MEGTLRLYHTDFSKNEIAAIFDDLDDERLFENHREIYETKLLMNFLSRGDPAIFDLEIEDEIYDYCSDFDLIAEFFVAQFGKTLADAFRSDNYWLIEKMNRFLFFIDDDVHLNLCFISVEKILVKDTEDFKIFLQKAKKHDFDEDEIELLFEWIDEAVHPETLNSLPDYFDLRRDTLANLIDQIVVSLYNDDHDPQFLLDLMEIADEIHAESLTRKRIRKNRKYLQEESEKLEFAKKVAEIERVAAAAEELKKITKDLNGRLISSSKDNKFGNRLFISGLKSKIQDILNFNEINNLSEEMDITSDLRDSIALELRRISVASYNHANDLDFSLYVIEMGLKIKVSSSTYNLLIKSQNHLISKKPVNIYPKVSEKFRVSETFSEDEISKVYTGQNRNSKSTTKPRSATNSTYKQTGTNKKKHKAEPLFNYEPADKKTAFQRVVRKLIIALVVVFGVMIFYFNHSSEDNKLNTFNSELQKMNSGTGFIVPGKNSEKVNQVKFKKKLLPINAKTKLVDSDFYNQMPTDVRADSFSEIKTFVWINCWNALKLDYPGSKLDYPGSNSYKSIMKCEIVEVDKGQNVVVGRKHFDGKPFSQVKTEEIPYNAIISFLIENSEK